MSGNGARPVYITLAPGPNSNHSLERHVTLSCSHKFKQAIKFSSIDRTATTLCAADRLMRSLLVPSGTVGSRIAGK
jgi:hypothetical protein